MVTKFVLKLLPLLNIDSVYVCSDPTVSQKHVRIRSLVFDDNEIGTIPPLVYADDLSTNGVFVQKSLVPRDEQSVSLHRVSGSVLLSHGDKLQLSSNLSLQYIVPPGQPACYGGLDTLQELELEVNADLNLLSVRR